jgi:hypothetical protein
MISPDQKGENGEFTGWAAQVARLVERIVGRRGRLPGWLNHAGGLISLNSNTPLGFLPLESHGAKSAFVVQEY